MDGRLLEDRRQRHESLLSECLRDFAGCYGAGPRPRCFLSPGRVNLFGGHLDYNGGPVMPTAIDRATLVAVRPRSDRKLRLASTLDANGLEFELEAAPTTRLERWVDYPMGVILDLLVRSRATRRESELCGLDILYGGDLPVGAGLSSSASICVGTAHALDAVWGLGLDTDQKVASALRAERGFVGVQCGIMDPYAVGYARSGHLLWLDCKDATFSHLPIDFSRLVIVVADTGVKRELAKGEFNLRVAQCREAFESLSRHVPSATVLRDVPLQVLEEHARELDDVVAMRARHVVSEVARTFQARDALAREDFERMGEIMTAAHGSLRDLYQVSTPELDQLVEAGVAAGALGARLTGAGFGGCVVMLAERGREDGLREHVRESFERAFGRRPEVSFFGGDSGPREITG